MATPYIRPEMIKFTFQRLGIIATDSDDGLISYTFTPNGDDVEYSGEKTINGNWGVIDSLNNGGELSLVVLKGSDLDKKMLMMSQVKGKCSGFFTDMTNEASTTNLVLGTTGVVKATLATSIENNTYIIRGNIVEKTI